MPASQGLVVTGGHPPRIAITLADRADWLVVAADSGLEWLHTTGIIPDAIVGDMDSLRDESLLDAYPDAVVERHDRAKDETDTELALSWIWSREVESITILGGGGGRLDHLIAILSLFQREPAPRRWITDREEVRLVDAVETLTGAPGDLISFFPVGGEVSRARTSGLRWPLDGRDWHHGEVGISNEFQEPTCRVEVLSGRFLMVREVSAPLVLR